VHPNRNFTILSVAFPLLPVTSGSGGGAEQILSLVERGLVEAGYRSIVVAAKGSEIAGTLIETPAATSEITEDIRADAQQKHAQAIEQALSVTKVDLIHFHGLDFCSYKPADKVPKLATLHLPCQWYPASIFNNGGVQINCVSQTQANAAPRTGLPVIPNGIDTSRYWSSTSARQYLLWLGRICPEKGVHIALRVARRLNLPMVIAGPVHPFRDHEMYFDREIRPLLDAERRYFGPVDLNTKVKLLSEAMCLLIPSLVAETSSLVAMEAIASGTPVVAFRSGALPEIVEHGRTGYIVDSEDEMAGAIAKISALSPEGSRLRASERFDAKRMINDYIHLYADVIGAFSSKHHG